MKAVLFLLLVAVALAAEDPSTSLARGFIEGAKILGSVTKMLECVSTQIMKTWEEVIPLARLSMMNDPSKDPTALFDSLRTLNRIPFEMVTFLRPCNPKEFDVIIELFNKKSKEVTAHSMHTYNARQTIVEEFHDLIAAWDKRDYLLAGKKMGLLSVIIFQY